MTKYNLPNESSTTNNYTSEMKQYEYLYLLSPRSSSTNISFTSTTSGITYDTTGTVYDNQGQEGMLLLLQNALKDYLISADDYNGISTQITEVNNRVTTSENSITNLSVETKDLKNKLYYYQAQSELREEALSRVVTGDVFGWNKDASYKLTIDYTKDNSTAYIPNGTTYLQDKFPNPSLFVVDKKYTIFNDEFTEEVTITGVDPLTCEPLVNNYKISSTLARSNMNPDGTFATWNESRTIVQSKKIVDTIATYNTDPSSKTSVRMDNGDIYYIKKFISTIVRIYKSTDNGNTFVQFGNDIVLTSITSLTLMSHKTMIYMLTSNATTMYCYEINTDGSAFVQRVVDSGNTAFSGADIIYNEYAKTIEAVFSTSRSTRPSILPRRNTATIDESTLALTWGTSIDIVTTGSQVTYAVQFKDPAIAVHPVTGKEKIVYTYISTNDGTTWYYGLGYAYKTIDTTIYTLSSHTSDTSSYNTSKFQNILPNPLVNDAFIIFYSTGQDIYMRKDTSSPISIYSTNYNLTKGLSMFIDMNNIIHMVWSSSASSGGGSGLSYRTYNLNTSSLGATVSITPTSVGDDSYDSISAVYYPTDTITIPFFIARNITTTDWEVFGDLTFTTKTLITKEFVRFTIDDTDEIVTWVKHGLSLNVTIKANNVDMVKVVDGDEDEFTKIFDIVAPIECDMRVEKPSIYLDNTHSILQIIGGVG